MPRPKLHERDETLRKAADFFWRNGFSGGSTRELGEALDMRPGSIYSAFGSKEGLCLEALEYYGRQTRDRFVELLEERGFFGGLREFLHTLVTDLDNPATCFVVKTLSSKLQCEQNLVTRSRELLAQFLEELRRQILTAQENGEISPHTDPSSFAALVQVQMIGLRSFADAATEGVDIEAVVEDSLELLKFRAGRN